MCGIPALLPPLRRSLCIIRCSSSGLDSLFKQSLDMFCDSQIRQYFLDESFYLADVTARGWCNDGRFQCEAFSPSSATVKVSGKRRLPLKVARLSRPSARGHCGHGDSTVGVSQTMIIKRVWVLRSGKNLEPIPPHNWYSIGCILQRDSLTRP